ncbi:type II secretion system protein M [Edwardsiella tarda]|uniref:type II secretion system protein GspM n=1 Tax=Edwardsiella tarda TaxID=636 RepID=UPI000D51C197|nr:type II secretion system protein GspM [Edwardsiella tarda]UCQ26579.1 type II secretion system protein M [Edwardsiella tarda]
MSRDKFIQKYQQWCEQQLNRAKYWLAQHLDERSQREKGMLLAVTIFLFIAGYYTLIWQSMSERIEQQETMLQQLVAMNIRLKSTASDIIAARKSGTSTLEQVSQVISDSASTHSVVIKRIAEHGEHIQIWIGPVVFNDLLAWLSELKEKSALSVTQLDVRKGEVTGMVNIKYIELIDK